MSCTRIHVQEMMRLDGTVQVYFRIEEPNDVPDAEKSFELPLDPQMVPFCDLAGVATGDRSALANDLVKSVGESVFQGLAVHQGVLAALNRIVHRDDAGPHPIIIETSAIDAESLPWEVLYHPAGRFLSLDARWPIARVIGRGGGGPSRYTFQPPLKIVAVLGAAERPGRPEWEALRQAVEDSGMEAEVVLLVAEDTLRQEVEAQGLANVKVSPMPGTDDALADALKAEAPHVLHFFCHGATEPSGYLEIATRNHLELGDDPVYISADNLRELQDVVWLVTLNACEGAAPAEGAHSMAYTLVDSGVPAVVGMREPIDSSDAHIFCRAFYTEFFGWLARSTAPGARAVVPWARFLRVPRKALCKRHSGPIGMKAARHKEWTLPVLYRRPEDMVIEVPAAGVALDDEERARRGAELETLRQAREHLPPETPIAVLDALHQRIETVEQALLGAD